MNQKNYTKKAGYILVEVITAVNIVTVIVLFCITVIFFYISVHTANLQQQAVLYILERELEIFMAEETAYSLAQDNLTHKRQSSYLVEDEELWYPVMITLLWQADTYNLASVSAKAEWDNGKKHESLQLYNKQKFSF